MIAQHLALLIPTSIQSITFSSTQSSFSLPPLSSLFYFSRNILTSLIYGPRSARDRAIGVVGILFPLGFTEKSVNECSVVIRECVVGGVDGCETIGDVLVEV